MTTRIIGWVILSASLALAATVQAAGGRNGGVKPPAPTITSASIDPGQRLLTIKGRSFGRDTPPSVLLGDIALRVQQSTDNQILAELPAGMKKASYRLIVSAGSAVRVNAEPFFATLVADVD